MWFLWIERTFLVRPWKPWKSQSAISAHTIGPSNHKTIQMQDYTNFTFQCKMRPKVWCHFYGSYSDFIIVVAITPPLLYTWAQPDFAQRRLSISGLQSISWILTQEGRYGMLTNLKPTCNGMFEDRQVTVVHKQHLRLVTSQID